MGSPIPMEIQAANRASVYNREERLLCGGASNSFSVWRFRFRGHDGGTSC